MALLLAAYVGVIASYAWGGAGATDTAGYFNCAKMLAQGRRIVAQRVLPGADRTKLADETFVPFPSFIARPDGMMAARNPTGFPLAIAGLAQIPGWDAAAHWIMPLVAVAGPLSVFALGWVTGLPRSHAWAAAILVAGGPLYLMMSGFLMSDVPSMACVTLAVTLAWLGRCTGRDRWFFLSGIFVAASVLVRPANMLVFLPIAICAGLDWRRWLLLGLGGLPGAIVLLGYNRCAFGHALTLGYSGDISEGDFPWRFMGGYLLRLLRLLPLLLPLGALALARNRRLTWIAAYLCFYSAFKSNPWWWNQRYLLPTFPPAMVGAMWVLGSFFRDQRALIRIGASLVVSAAALAVEIGGDVKLEVCSSGRLMSFFSAEAQWLRDNLPSNSVVVASRALTGAAYFYTPFPVVTQDQVQEVACWNEIVRAASAPAGRSTWLALCSRLESIRILSRRIGRSCGRRSFFRSGAMIREIEGHDLPPLEMDKRTTAT